MLIRDNIEKMMKKIQSDPDTGQMVREKALKAIKAGEGSNEWRDYMTMFAEDERQLARLLPTDQMN
jgi:hypothetical protein